MVCPSLSMAQRRVAVSGRHTVHVETIRPTRAPRERVSSVPSTLPRHGAAAGAPSLAVLVKDDASRVRIRSALASLGVPCFPTSSAELLDALMRHRIGAVIVEPDGGGSDDLTEALIRTIRRDFPSLPVLLYCQLTAGHVRCVPGLIRAGADEVVLRGVDDVQSVLRRALHDASTARAGNQVLEALRRVAPKASESLLAYCLAHADRPLTVAQFARGLGVHRKTLCNRASVAGLPAPSVLISWCRLLHAARLLDGEERSVERVALLLGFGSGTALRNMLRRYTGLRPTELRLRGGSRLIVALIEKEVAGAGSDRLSEDRPCSGSVGSLRVPGAPRW